MHVRSDICMRRLEVFRDLCRTSAPWDEVDRIREAAALKRILSLERCCNITGPYDQLLENLIIQGAHECAALEIIGERAEFDLSGGIFRDCSARVRLADQAIASDGEGTSMALALLNAWANALLATAGQNT